MIGGGINSTANPATVSFAWHRPGPNETSDLTATSPPMGHSGNPGGIANFLASDVLQLTGMSVTNVVTGQTDAYGLSMSYNPSLVGSAVPFLATLLPNGYWENAINGNFGSGNLASPGTPFVESLATFMENNNLPALTTNLRHYVGDWGYDPATDTAWAIVDFQSDSTDGNYAFAVVPEPSSVALLVAGAVGLLVYVRRRRIGAGAF